MAGSVVWLDVLPSLAMFGKTLTVQANAAARKSGISAGRQFSAGLASGGSKTGAAALVEQLEVASKKAQTVVKQEQVRITAARSAEKASAEAVEAAEARLAAARTKYGEASVQALKAQSALTTAEGRGAVATQKFALEMDALKASQSEAKVTTAQLTEAQAALAKEQRVAQSGLGRFVTGSTGVVSSAKRMGSAFSGATKMLGGLGVTFAAFGFADFVKSSVESASEFQSEMNLLVTAGGESKTALSSVSAGVEKISKTTGTSLTDLAAGMYTVEKAQIRGADGLKVLKAAAQAAKAEGTDLSTMSNAITSIMTSYDMPASHVVQVTNELVAASGAAKTTMQEYAGSLATVLPIASKAGVSFAQVSGAIATLTNHGTSADEATQELANTIRNLQAPNNVAVQEMSKLGLSANDVSQNLGKRGLTGTVQLLVGAVAKNMGPAGLVIQKTLNQSTQAAADANEAFEALPTAAKKVASAYANGTISLGDYRKAIRGLPTDQANLVGQWKSLEDKSKGYNNQLRNSVSSSQTATKALKDMVGGSTGLNTVLQLSGSSASKFSANVDEVTKAGKNNGKNISTWASTSALFKTQLAKLKQTITVTGTQMATKMLPHFLKFVKTLLAGIKAGAKFASANKAWLKPLVIGILGLVGAFKILTATTAILNAVLDANPIVLIGLAIAALVVGVIYAYTHFKTFRTIVQTAWKGIQVAASFAWNKVLKPAFNWIVGAVQNTGKWFTNLWKNKVVPAWDGITTAFKVSKAVMSGVWNWITGAIKTVGGWFSWFRNMVGGVFSWIGNAAGVFGRGVAKVAQAIAAPFVWLYKNIIAPVFSGINAVFQWFNAAFTAVGYLVWTIIKDTISIAFTWLYQNVVKPAWTGILSVITRVWGAVSSVITTVWNSAIKPAFSAISLAVHAVGGAFRWFFNTVEGIVIAIMQALWNAEKFIANVVFAALRGAVRVVGAVFVWLHTNVVVPVWNAIKAAISAVWNIGIRPVFNAMRSATHSVGNAFSWLYNNAIKPAWNSISSVVGTVWSKGIKPVFSAMKNWVTKNIPAAFKSAVGAVKSAWNGIKNVVKAPIKFIVNTVLDGGLIDPFNKIATAVEGSKKAKLIPRINLPKGFARGGVIPGYQSAKRDDVMLPMRRGEGVLVPEVVRALGPATIHALNAAGNSGGVQAVKARTGFATGGIVGALSSAWDWTKNAASVVADPMGTLGKVVQAALSRVPGAGSVVDFGKGIVTKALSSVVDVVKNLAGVGSAGSSSANPTGSGVTRWTADVKKALAANGLSTSSAMVAKVLRQISTESGGNPNAVQNGYTDVNTLSGDLAKGLMQTISATFNAYKFPGHGNIFNGYDNLLAALNYAKNRYGSNLDGLGEGHGYAYGGIIPSLYDSGGLIPEGVSVIAKKTKDPEFALPMKTLQTLVGGSGEQQGPSYTAVVNNNGRDFTERDLRTAFGRMAALAGGR